MASVAPVAVTDEDVPEWNVASLATFRSATDANLGGVGGSIELGALDRPSAAASSDARVEDAPAAVVPATEAPRKRNAWGHIRDTWLIVIGSLSIAVGYIVADNKKHKRSLVVGVATVFIVVCFLSYVPRLRELTRGRGEGGHLSRSLITAMPPAPMRPSSP